MRIGVLALQGAVEPHRAKLKSIGAEGVLVRTAAEIETCAGLIVPGGESTTFLKLIGVYGLRQPLLDFAAERPMLGVCAGSILMAREVCNPPQECLKLMPVTVQRNGYGRQNESFISEVKLSLPGRPASLQEMVFIRAPKFLALDNGVEVLAEFEGDPVAVQYGQHLATAFHPELSAPDSLHEHFVNLCRGAASRASA